MSSRDEGIAKRKKSSAWDTWGGQQRNPSAPTPPKADTNKPPPEPPTEEPAS